MSPTPARAIARTIAIATATAVTAALSPAAAAPPRSAGVASGPAPGGPGKSAQYLPADKAGFGTSTTRRSHVWFTLQRGGTGEIYFPDLGTPAARRLQFAVVDAGGHAERAGAVHRTTVQVGRQSLTYRETDERSGHWRLRLTTVTDPRRATVLVRAQFLSLDGSAYRLYALYEPTLSGTGGDDAGYTKGAALVAHDASAASALEARPAFTGTSTGYRGTASDGWRDLQHHGRLTAHYSSASPGNLVQTARTTLTGRKHHTHLVVSLGFARRSVHALSTAAASLSAGFRTAATAYAAGWRHYLAGLRQPPTSLRTVRERLVYRTSEMVLAASEDKLHPGAYVASPTMPWIWGAQVPVGPYHLVWSRDLYEIATALIADGDRAGANRALTFLFTKQQKPDGSFPQNSTVAGTPFWTGLQLDEVADPIVLAYQLHRFSASSWRHVQAAAHFLITFKQDGYAAPYTPQDRWENQSGYSPATIASEIAGLVCAAVIARHNGAGAAAHHYLKTADAWRAGLKGWTVTHDGPYSTRPYFLRLTKDGHPNRGTTYSIGDSGPSAADQRSVVDPSFLELVRFGVLPASDRTIRNSIAVVDRQLSYRTPRGRFWHRASYDGYGETWTGKPWNFNNPADSFVTHGRGWPLLTGERGEYDIAAGHLRLAATRLATMSRSTNAARLLPEQVWDNAAPAGQPGFRPGTPTMSAMPLAWTHAQYIRLAVDLAAHRVTEQPAAVAQRYSR